MEIRTENENDVEIVSIEGELDTETSPEAEAYLNKMRADGTRKILLDFEKLDFISSAGLRVLLATAQEMESTGGGLRVCCLNRDVKEVFDISGFSTLLGVFDSQAKALVGF